MNRNLEKVYRFKTSDMRILYLTAPELYTEFIKESDNKWGTSILEVLNICNDKDFPKDYAKQINLGILESFINSDVSIFDISFKERSALFSCYNYLSSANEKESNARQKFLIKFLDEVTESFILQEPTSTSDNYINACEIYDSWKQSLIKDLLSKDNLRFSCLNQKNLFKSFKKAFVTKVGKKSFMEYVKENKSQQGNFFQYARVATNI